MFDVLVVVWVENLFTIGVADADRLAVVVAYIVLEGILLVSFQSVDGYPPASGFFVACHLTGLVVGEKPTIEVTHNVGIILALAVLVLVIEHKGCSGFGVVYIDTFLHAAWHLSCFHFTWYESLVFRIRYADERIGINTFLGSVCTADDNTELLYGSLARTEPFADSGR